MKGSMLGLGGEGTTCRHRRHLRRASNINTVATDRTGQGDKEGRSHAQKCQSVLNRKRHTRSCFLAGLLYLLELAT